MAELTTSRVNRQFRSLRMKCSSLNAFAIAPPKPAVTVTYGSTRTTIRRAQEQDETPPLAILQSLDNFGTRLHLDRAIVENMQLSKRIYEVRDAFRNIVQSSMGTPQDCSNQRMLPLAAICARLVGEHVQSELAMATDGSGDNGLEDDAGARLMDDLYEQVPAAYRPRMFVAHSLSYILEACPHHPTLLNALLEVCMAHSLVQEAHTVLSSIFAAAIEPRAQSTYACPLTHPAHKNFLSTLLETCSSTIVNDRTFTRILVEAMSEASSARFHAWTSKAMAHLARDLRERDFPSCFVPLCGGIATSLVESRRRTKSVARSSKAVDHTSDLHNASLERLAKWVVSMLDVLYASASNDFAGFRACIDFLVDTAPYQLHVSDDLPTSPTTCLADALLCLTAYCLSSPHATALHPSELATLRSILQVAHIRNDTFDGLVSHVFPLPRLQMFAMPLAEPEDADTPTPPPSFPDTHDGGLEALSSLAAPLRAHGLLKCEAALWLAALQHVEELISAPTITQSMTTPGRKLNQSELYNLRIELMDRVEDAERRCFGGGLGGGMAGVAPPGADGEWEWEEMVGSWVLKSPAVARAKKAKDTSNPVKRRKVDDKGRSRLSLPGPQPRVREAFVAARQSASVAPRTTNHTVERESSASACLSSSSRRGTSLKRKASSISVAPTRAPSRAASPKGNSSEDEENTAPPQRRDRPAKLAKPAPARRPSNFTTILADAQLNVISLRAEREREDKAKDKVKAQSRPASASLARTRSFPAHTPPAPPRRHSNFATLLADSQRNVISLRDERARKARYARRSSEHTMSDSEDELLANVRSGRPRETYAPEPESSPVREMGMGHASSDDALNLFAYPDSSPMRPR